MFEKHATRSIITDQRRANCSQTTGERLALSVASHGGGGGAPGVRWGCTGCLMGEGGQPLRTALHTISISLQNSFCESHTWRLVS